LAERRAYSRLLILTQFENKERPTPAGWAAMCAGHQRQIFTAQAIITVAAWCLMLARFMHEIA
jgi:hypothetical protein